MTPDDLERISREAANDLDGARAMIHGGLRFSRRGFDGRVDFLPKSTDILFDTKNLAVESIHVAPAGFWHDLKHLFGITDYQTGDKAFDKDFEIHVSSADFAARVLRKPLRSVLRTARDSGKFLWRLSPAGFLYRVVGWPPDRYELHRRLLTAFQLLEALPGVAAKDRPKAAEAPPLIFEDAACRVCHGSLVQGKVVRCAKCTTPHHRDCWDFNGRCSTFGCGETRTKRL